MSDNSLEPRRWLISRRADFWFASAGASSGLVAALALIVFYGDRQLDWLDLVLSELHLGATYDSIIRRRLWRRLPVDVVVLPLLILAGISALMISGQGLFVTTMTMYVAIWHRGRQNLGLARFYQRLGNGPVSAAHRRLFAGAIYAPMLAAAFLYSHLVPEEYEGEPYFAFDIGAQVAWGLGLTAFACVVAYVIWSYGRNLHQGERWIILAHAVSFGSAYVLGAANASFLFVLTVQHEVQYLYFTYAMARWPIRKPIQIGRGENPGSEVRFAASFALWPVIGLTGAMSSVLYESEWLAAFGVGVLFCHYWLDGRIWTRRAMAD